MAKRQWLSALVTITALTVSGAPAFRTAGAVPANSVVTARVYLTGRDPAGLAALAAAYALPGHAPFLSTQAAQRRFGPDPAQAARVAARLHTAGLQVVNRTDHYLTVRATAAQLRHLPAVVARDVLAVTGLDTTAGHAQPAAATPSCSAGYYGQAQATSLPAAYGATVPWAPCGYTPAQVRTAYGLTGTGYTGVGSTIAVVDAYTAPTLLGDANRYATNRGDSPFATGQFSTVIAPGASPPVGNWGFEQALDVEAVHAVAPDAKVVYVGARDDQDSSFVDVYQRIVDDHLADIVSSSWVLEHDDQIDPGLLAVFEQTFQLGAVTGIGFYAASGDDGGLATAAGSSTPFVSYPAASPWVTAVGGTSLAIGPSGEYRWEAGWETDSTGLDPAGTSWVAPPGAFSTGAGGGRSTRFGEPAYQRGVVPSAISQGRRTVPDIAALADPVTGLLEGASFTPPGGAPTYVEFASGGTSLATPIIAGIQADAQQALGHPIGFANPLLYALSRIGVTHDVVADPLHDGRPIADAKLRQGVDASGHPTTVPTLVTLDRAADAGLVTRRGYDTVTGIGTPNPRYLSLVAARAN